MIQQQYYLLLRSMICTVVDKFRVPNAPHAAAFSQHTEQHREQQLNGRYYYRYVTDNNNNTSIVHPQKENGILTYLFCHHLGAITSDTTTTQTGAHKSQTSHHSNATSSSFFDIDYCRLWYVEQEKRCAWT